MCAHSKKADGLNHKRTNKLTASKGQETTRAAKTEHVQKTPNKEEARSKGQTNATNRVWDNVTQANTTEVRREVWNKASQVDIITEQTTARRRRKRISGRQNQQNGCAV